MDENPPLGGFLAKLCPLAGLRQRGVCLGLHSGECGLPEGIRDLYRVPLCTYFLTYDFVGHWL